MISKVRVMFAASLAVIAGAGFVLQRAQAVQHLGQPGVVVIDEPMPTTKGGIAGTNSVKLPAYVPGWKSKLVEISEDELKFLPADTTYGRRYYEAADGFGSSVFAVLMKTDRGSIHRPQLCLTGQGWNIQRSDTAAIRIARPHPYDLEVMKLTASRTVTLPDGKTANRTGVFVYWFVADGQLTAHHGTRMWWMARDLITKGVLQRWAYVAYFAVCIPGQEDAAFNRLKELIAATVPEFQLVASPQVPQTSAAVQPPGQEPFSRK